MTGLTMGPVVDTMNVIKGCSLEMGDRVSGVEVAAAWGKQWGARR